MDDNGNRMISAERSSEILSPGTSLTGLDSSRFNEDINDLPNRTTPFEANPPELPWYKHILSEWNTAWIECGDFWRTGGYQNKLYAIVFLFCLPACVIRRAASPVRNFTVPDHTSVGYLFLLMCYTLVMCLIEFHQDLLKARYIFVVACMIVAITAMLYLYLFTIDRVGHDPYHDAPIRLFFRGGLYIFGFVSITNSICLAVYEWSCPTHNHKTVATLLVVKALFVVTETLFLGYFHKACLPLDTPLLQICLSHILGTNLALWFWTLCEETREKFLHVDVNCSSKPMSDWLDYQKYCYPIFVEYLILGLAILYGLWANLRRNEPTTLCRFCRNCARCIYRSQNRVNEELEPNGLSLNRLRQYKPRCSFGITVGVIYVAVFLVIMLRAIQETKIYPTYMIKRNGRIIEVYDVQNATDFDKRLPFKAYCYCAVVMYLSMISSCYIILTSLRSPNNSHRIRSIDYDDVLLYISLMGILLLEGFHVVSKVITGETEFHVLAVDIIGTVQHLTQAVTLMNLSHCRGTASRLNKTWICECILFLFLTNIAWWIEDTFYLQSRLTRPGELAALPGTETYGTIVKPMVIFFRFHSATYFYQAWTIYRI